MWPGQQPPGGEQNPQDGNQNQGGTQNPQDGNPNPYQQPAQPGSEQPPNPYQQPAQPGGYGYPQQPPAPPQGGGYGFPQDQPPAPPQGGGYGFPQDQPPAQAGGYGFPPQQPPAQAGGYGYPQQQPDPTNPYAQPPGFDPANPYGQGAPQPQTVEGWQYAQPGYDQGAGVPAGRRKTTMVAIIATAVVVVAGAVMGAYVLTQDKDKKDEADGKPSAAPSTSSPASPSANPRAGGEVKPVIPGWKVVVNPKYGTAFDVPPEWRVATPDTYSGFADEKKNDGLPVISFSAPAFYKEKWCEVDSDKDGDTEDYSLAGTGTKGAQGAKDTATAAYNEAGSWVWAAYAQKAPKGTVKVAKAKPFTTKSGLKGHYATAKASKLKKEHKCSTDGKSIAFSFRNAKGDFSTWVLYGPDHVKDELSGTVIKKILSSVRLTTG
ncbi:hypothetical protein [Streptomyces sp. NRRL S-87]|uniref:hypothetical protein n=1 Tax=Streptomyces sp. NRRL S-87 TaxID=1463920 RepID=UPI0004C02339|nr:hypothetical protein [Streptomyces sp. NRRL S-87]